jgi:hypothetical protein
MAEGRDLSFVEALGKLGVLGVGRGFGIEGIAGDVGVRGADGGVRGLRGVGAAGEKTGEKASEAQGGDFKEIAFGARGGQKGHELGSRCCMGKAEVRQGYRGASEATMTPKSERAPGSALWIGARLAVSGLLKTKDFRLTVFFFDLGDIGRRKDFLRRRLFPNLKRDEVHQNS